MDVKSFSDGEGLDSEGVAGAYDRLAPVYDLVFGRVFRGGRRAAVSAANRIGGEILEVGVGTGLSLADYDEHCTVVGVDISADMLQRARSRAVTKRLKNVRALDVMDAEALTYSDASFDAVVAQYVITAVPNPERALNELVRVLRPGGEMIITSRIGAEQGVRSTVEAWLTPVTTRLGWRTQFPWSRYERWAAGMPAIRVIEHRPLPPLGHFALIRFLKVQNGSMTEKELQWDSFSNT